MVHFFGDGVESLGPDGEGGRRFGAVFLFGKFCGVGAGGAGHERSGEGVSRRISDARRVEGTHTTSDVGCVVLSGEVGLRLFVVIVDAVTGAAR